MRSVGAFALQNISGSDARHHTDKRSKYGCAVTHSGSTQHSGRNGATIPASTLTTRPDAVARTKRWSRSNSATSSTSVPGLGVTDGDTTASVSGRHTTALPATAACAIQRNSCRRCTQRTDSGLWVSRVHMSSHIVPNTDFCQDRNLREHQSRLVVHPLQSPPAVL